MKTLIAPYVLAKDIMSDLFNLYWCAVFSSLNVKHSDIEALGEEGLRYVQNKFIEIAEDFEKDLGIKWSWYEK